MYGSTLHASCSERQQGAERSKSMMLSGLRKLSTVVSELCYRNAKHKSSKASAATLSLSARGLHQHRHGQLCGGSQGCWVANRLASLLMIGGKHLLAPGKNRIAVLQQLCRGDCARKLHHTKSRSLGCSRPVGSPHTWHMRTPKDGHAASTQNSYRPTNSLQAAQEEVGGVCWQAQ